ncbi:hypothetical protein NVP1111B_38 [Vibrio phage 1.111.B._10N.286.45.E6]|nr:hypothetical protein NVP1111A_38 [Vibrio phage 1.111.A._10N.286.45.E6]AUR88294.1 hypothetical protein NVP1111B_38 [Vibrio phage 1.111.B._10N.286.45.E6]
MKVNIQPEKLSITRDHTMFNIELSQAQLLEVIEKLPKEKLPSPEVIHEQHHYDGEALHSLAKAAYVLSYELAKFADSIEEFNQ